MRGGCLQFREEDFLMKVCDRFDYAENERALGLWYHRLADSVVRGVSKRLRRRRDVQVHQL